MLLLIPMTIMPCSGMHSIFPESVFRSIQEIPNLLLPVSINMAIRSALWTEHNSYSLENQAESTVPCGTNGSVINLFRPAIHGDVPVKLPAPILLMENAPILILTRISEILPAFPEIQNIEQAQAYLREYNRMNRIKKGKIPTNEETIKMRLYNIYMSQNNHK